MEAYKAGEWPIEPKCSISNFQRVSCQFNLEFELSKESMKRFEESNTDKDRKVLVNAKGHIARLQVIATAVNEEPDDEITDQKPIVESIDLVSISSTAIEMDLIFVNPINVSKGDEPDLLLLALDLSELETIQGKKLPSNIKISRQIPTQMLN